MDSTSAENVSISEVLSGQITDWEGRKNDFGARSGELIELRVDDVPLSIDDLLEFLWAVDPDLSIILLSLKLELHVQDGDHWILELLWLLLETGV